MTRRDYVLISGALKDAMARTAPFSHTRQGVRVATQAVIDALRAKNPRGFDADQFWRDVEL